MAASAAAGVNGKEEPTSLSMLFFVTMLALPELI